MKENSFFKKFITTFVASLTVSALLLVVGNGGSIKWFPTPVVFSLIGISLTTAVIFPFAWHHIEKKIKLAQQKFTLYFIQ